MYNVDYYYGVHKFTQAGFDTEVEAEEFVMALSPRRKIGYGIVGFSYAKLLRGNTYVTEW